MARFCPLCRKAEGEADPQPDPESIPSGKLVSLAAISEADEGFDVVPAGSGVVCDNVASGACHYALVMSPQNGMFQPRHAEPDPARSGELRVRSNQ